MIQQDSDVQYYNKTQLENNLTIVTERVPAVKSVTIGIWVKTGSRHETDQQAGITHFLEHMLFKGTKSRSSYDIALSMESVGGYLNAFTSSEYTCYFARCLADEIDTAIDVLSDMVLHPSFPEQELEKEKKVVLEEMKMYRDSPDDYSLEQFNELLFDGDPLGRPVIGYEETVSYFDREALYDYMDQRYKPGNLIISAAGAVDHDEIVAQVKNYFTGISSKNGQKDSLTLAEYTPKSRDEHRSIEQTHYLIGRRGLKADHTHKYTLLLANTILGGGMSSRLHQNIREQYGYCYNIQTVNQVYRDTGLFGIYAGTDAEYVDHLRKLILQELKRLAAETVPPKELEEAKTQLKGKLLLSQENTSSRMSRLGKSELYFNRFISLDELIEEINGVTAADIQSFAQQFFSEEQFSEFKLLPEE